MQELLSYINDNSFLGIPMDVVAHFMVGAFIVISGLMFRIPFGAVLVVLFTLTTAKEVRDFLVYNSPLDENIKDYFFSFLYPLILTPVRMSLKGENWYK